MNLLHAIGCPYCEGVLFKESYVLRCGRDHRFAASFQPAVPAGSAIRVGPPPDGGSVGAEVAKAGVPLPVLAAGAGVEAASTGAPLAVPIAGTPSPTPTGEASSPADVCGPHSEARYLLRVVWHADRQEVGRIHAFTVGDG